MRRPNRSGSRGSCMPSTRRRPRRASPMTASAAGLSRHASADPGMSRTHSRARARPRTSPVSPSHTGSPDTARSRRMVASGRCSSRSLPGGKASPSNRHSSSSRDKSASGVFSAAASESSNERRSCASAGAPASELSAIHFCNEISGLNARSQYGHQGGIKARHVPREAATNAPISPSKPFTVALES